jgi:3-isopropylmalate/(R)-2-methylmalate dehydratase small subunit
MLEILDPTLREGELTPYVNFTVDEKVEIAKCVIAASFARIFFRNAINIGLPILGCPAAAAGITEGEDIDVDLASGEIFNRTKGNRYQAHPLPDFVLKIADAGGILNFLKEHDIQDLIA